MLTTEHDQTKKAALRDVAAMAAAPRTAPQKVSETNTKGETPRQKGYKQKGGKQKGKNKDQKGGKYTQQWGQNRYRPYNDGWQAGGDSYGWNNNTDEWADNSDKSKKADNETALTTTAEKLKKTA